MKNKIRKTIGISARFLLFQAAFGIVFLIVYYFLGMIIENDFVTTIIANVFLLLGFINYRYFLPRLFNLTESNYKSILINYFVIFTTASVTISVLYNLNNNFAALVYFFNLSVVYVESILFESRILRNYQWLAPFIIFSIENAIRGLCLYVGMKKRIKNPNTKNTCDK